MIMKEKFQLEGSNMNTLILDCSCGMSIYLITEKADYSHIDKNQKKHTDELLLSVDELLNKAELQIQDIDNICVCIGPGSFTGIRVAVSICKGLAIGAHAKIFVADNFEIVSYNESKKSIFVLDGFSDFIYTRFFDGENSKDSCEKISEFVDKIKTSYNDYNIYIQSEKMQNLFKNYEIHADFVQNKIKNVFFDKIKQNKTTQINQISPIYLRASQAEIERNEKLKRNNENG